jgi:putative transposase
VISRAVIVAVGIIATGQREVLGIELGDSEDEAFWTAFLRRMRERGLSGMQLVISDAHAGLKKAIARYSQGCSWQRCRVHFARNLLAKVPKGRQDMVAAALRSVFVQAVTQAVAQLWNQVITMLTEKISRRCGPDGAGQGRRPNLPGVHNGALAQDLEHLNPLERLNVAPRGALGSAVIKRRTRVVGIFPNDATIIRLVGALLLEQQEKWQLDGRRAFSEVSMAKLDKSSEPVQTQSIESCTRYSCLITDS